MPSPPKFPPSHAYQNLCRRMFALHLEHRRIHTIHTIFSVHTYLEHERIHKVGAILTPHNLLIETCMDTWIVVKGWAQLLPPA